MSLRAGRPTEAVQDSSILGGEATELPPYAGAPDGEGQPPRPASPRRRRIPKVPYLLLLPAVVVLAAIQGYPMFLVIKFSFQEFGIRQLFLHQTIYNGFANYTAILKDSNFWHVVLRTFVFTFANVALTIVLGMIVALLISRVGRLMRGATTIAMVAAWAMPTAAAPIVWNWLFQPGFGGVVDYVLGNHFGHFQNLNWFNTSGILAFSVITAMIVWQAIPFVAITLQAGLTQVPSELYEAARIDGATGWAVFRNVTLPLIKPILLLLTILSTIWDFTVFNQIWLLSYGGPNNQTETLGVYTFTQAFSANRWGAGSAIAVVTVLLLAGITAYYVRRLVRAGEIR